MRTRRWVFWFSVAALMGSLILYGKCMAHPVYDEHGMMVGCTTAWEATPCEDEGWVIDAPTLLGAEVERVWLASAEESRSEEKPSLQGVVISGHLVYPSECGEYPGILDLLRECLGYIQDSSVIYNDPSDRDNYLTESTPAIYQLRSAQTDADDAAQAAQEQADRMRERAERYRRETELHKKIKAMIEKLEEKK